MRLSVVRIFLRPITIDSLPSSPPPRLETRIIRPQIATFSGRAILLSSLLLSTTQAEVRTWSDGTGTFTVEAELIRVDDGVVHLAKPDGKKLLVPLARLAPADQRYVNAVSTAADKSQLINGQKEVGHADDQLGKNLTAVPGDARNDWVGSYFVVRKREGGIWILTFNKALPGCEAGVPFLLIERVRVPTTITLESPGKGCRIRLFANQAMVTFPGSDKTVPEDKYGGLWFTGPASSQVPLAPTQRTWHPEGIGDVKGVIGLPTAIGSEDLRKQLNDPDALSSMVITIVSDQKHKVSLNDLPAIEKAAAVYDLALVNAPRWVTKTGTMSQVDFVAARNLLAAVPEEWQRLIDASKKNAVRCAILSKEIERAVQETIAMQKTIADAVMKTPVLQQPVEKLDVESFAMLSEAVMTKFDDRLTKPALDLIMGKSDGLDSLDIAVGDGAPQKILDMWIQLSRGEKDALLILATRTLYGRLRCPHSKLTHIGLLSRACEIVAKQGPKMCLDLEQMRRQDIDKLLQEQLDAAADHK